MQILKDTSHCYATALENDHVSNSELVILNSIHHIDKLPGSQLGVSGGSGMGTETLPQNSMITRYFSNGIMLHMV